MSSRATVLRNVAIVVAIATAVYALPGGGSAASLVRAILSLLFAIGIAFFAGRLYLEHRVAIHGLGDRHRLLLYGAIAVAFLTLAGTNRLQSTGAGTLAWLALLAACVFALVAVYRHSREY